MKNDDKQILDWAIGKITSEYKNDVALLIGHGFDKLAEQTPGGPLEQFKGEFDYFVPDTERAYKLSQSFIVNDIGYDLYPRSWASLDSMAELNDCHTSCLADAAVLYARSDEDRARFEAVRKKLLCNLRDGHYTYHKAMNRLSMAMEIYQTMVFAEKLYEVRASSAFILDYLAQAVAFVNGNYFKRGTQDQLEEMKGFQCVPETFAKDYQRIILAESAEEIKQLCYRILAATKSFLQGRQPACPPGRKPDFHGLADWYQELGHTWRKIYNGCQLGDVSRVFFWGCSLQHELDIIREEFGLSEMDLLGSYQPEDLSRIQARAEEIERYITDTIARHSVNIAIYASVDEFLAKNG